MVASSSCGQGLRLLRCNQLTHLTSTSCTPSSIFSGSCSRTIPPSAYAATSGLGVLAKLAAVYCPSAGLCESKPVLSLASNHVTGKEEKCTLFDSRSWLPHPRISGRRIVAHSSLTSGVEMEAMGQERNAVEGHLTGETAPPSASEKKGGEAGGSTVPQKSVKTESKADAEDASEGASTSNTHNKGDLSTITVGGLSLQGVSVGGQETCIIIPSMKLAFDVGRCPQRAVFQENVLISHAHMDHIGGICLQAATRGLFSLKPPRIVVPKVIVPGVENLFNAFRALDNAELQHNLIGLEIGEELRLTGELFVKPFRTYHVVPSQGYVVYSRRQKLKIEFVGLPGAEIGRLRKSGVEITDVEEVPEVAFTGDTTAEFLTDPANADVLRAKLLIMEMTFIDDSSTVEHARKWGHTHIDEVVPLAHLFQNEAILFIHFSARYRRKDILKAIDGLPPGFREKVTPLLERF